MLFNKRNYITINFFKIFSLIFLIPFIYLFGNNDVKKYHFISDLSNLQTKLDSTVVNFTSSDTTAKISYTIIDCFTGEMISHNGATPMHAASSFKTYLGAYLFYCYEQDSLQTELKEQIDSKNSHLQKMLEKSNNLSTTEILKIVKNNLDGFNQFMHDTLNMERSIIKKWFYTSKNLNTNECITK